MKPLLAVLLFCPLVLAASAESDIRSVLARQVADWNRGNIPAFMQGYDNSDQTIFIGKTVSKGWQQVLRRYQAAYPTSERMGRLAFSELEVRPLGSDYALVTGRFHLTRDAAAGGEASGVFSLVFHRNASGAWKIIADHTSS